MRASVSSRFWRGRACACAVVVVWLAWGSLVWGQAPRAESVAVPQAAALDQLAVELAEGPGAWSPDELAELARQVEAWAVIEVGRLRAARGVPRWEPLQGLLEAKERVEQWRSEQLSGREALAELSREALCHWLWAMTALTDLSGRLRYVQSDAVRELLDRWSGRPEVSLALVHQLAERRSGIGAALCAGRYLTQSGGASRELQSAVLELMAGARSSDVLAALAEFVLAASTAPDLVVQGAGVIRELGLPQDPRPGSPADLPQPAITARQLHGRLARLKPEWLSARHGAERSELLVWLEGRRDRGVTEETYRWGTADVRAGDWLLMRNPSPFNRFTDLSPGLYTHVGVAAWEAGGDGLRRMVVVDFPERGATVPATNVELYVERTVDYVWLRHPDPAVAERMGEAAAAVIGNPLEFDLNFRSERLESLRGQPLAGQKIHAYCAGLLLLCAQSAGLSREVVFPREEGPAEGHTAENIGQLGLSLGARFVSPTGALYGSQLRVVAQREPMYDPTREIEEAIYDHFAERLKTEPLRPTATWSQSLREKLAEASRWNRLLARALASAAGVSAETDLVSAAKAAAVVETLDEIAQGASREFVAARDAIRAGGPRDWQRNGWDGEQVGRVRQWQRTHAELTARWQRGELAPRELRVDLARWAIERGRRALDARFFAGP